MSAGAVVSQNYFVQLFALLRHSAIQLVRTPSHSQRAEAARRLARHALILTAILGACVIALMNFLDAREIALMPARGAPNLWPVRILTDFGKDAYVLWMLATALLFVALASPFRQGTARARLLRFGTQLQYLFFAVLVPVLFAEVVKWAAGRGRPFVGGRANPFNFAPFTGTEAYFSFPSGHAVTGFALAFAIGAVWPQTRLWMLVYALLIAASRLVLLAHHPSDVVAGALIGVLGAMAVRYWFAARQLGFAIHGDGKIVPL
jgi:membrane-associated phospholipid phosphatase